MWTLKVCGLTVGTRCELYIRTSIEGGKFLDYWVYDSGHFDPATINNIDIHTLQGASNRLSPTRQRWLAKFLSG